MTHGGGLPGWRRLAREYSCTMLFRSRSFDLRPPGRCCHCRTQYRTSRTRDRFDRRRRKEVWTSASDICGRKVVWTSASDICGRQRWTWSNIVTLLQYRVPRNGHDKHQCDSTRNGLCAVTKTSVKQLVLLLTIRISSTTLATIHTSSSHRLPPALTQGQSRSRSLIISHLAISYSKLLVCTIICSARIESPLVGCGVGILPLVGCSRHWSKVVLTVLFHLWRCTSTL